jgi:pyruvate,water dikinase
MTNTVWIGEAEKPLSASVVGGKGRGLDLLVRAGLRVPEAFVITTDCFGSAVTPSLRAELDSRIAKLAGETDLGILDAATEEVRTLLFDGTAGHAGENDIRAAHRSLRERTGQDDLAVAVRSSSAAEDAADRSFAGEHDTYLWVLDEDEVCEQVRRCWASLFTSRAVSYRAAAQADPNAPEDQMAVVVQRMVDAEAAGVFMTLNPLNGDRSKIVIEALWGLGEPLVSGMADPDRFTVDKVTREILKREIASKPERAARNAVSGRGIANRPVPAADQNSSSISDETIGELVRMARVLEKSAGCPQDGEFAIAGGAAATASDADRVFLVQARPETVWSTKPARSVSAGGTDALSRVISTLTRTSGQS